ncbi:MAG: ubiquinone/menaquinone biosynthesis methyltransferase [Anaerolineaceae bacterium]|nr:ubiquinone/menaquinone biosynthesis methyltransferase [Anaerolineaceae bacterium]
MIGDERAARVQGMFDRIARHYRLLNTLMTAGQDRRWRRHVVDRAALPRKGRLLDLATGTGDIAREALRARPDLRVTGADFSTGMMQAGRQMSDAAPMHWVAADAMRLPFADDCFDAVTSGYLVRNVLDIPGTLQEQMRVLRPGGRLVILESSPPAPSLLRPFIELHLRLVIPLLGRLIAGPAGASAYRYLPRTTQAFHTAQELAAIMQAAGLTAVTWHRFMFGTMAVHEGVKPPR